MNCIITVFTVTLVVLRTHTSVIFCLSGHNIRNTMTNITMVLKRRFNAGLLDSTVANKLAAVYYRSYV